MLLKKMVIPRRMQEPGEEDKKQVVALLWRVLYIHNQWFWFGPSTSREPVIWSDLYFVSRAFLWFLRSASNFYGQLFLLVTKIKTKSVSLYLVNSVQILYSQCLNSSVLGDLGLVENLLKTVLCFSSSFFQSIDFSV